MKEEFVFKRNFYSKLLEWKSESCGSTCALVEGARRIGKSTLCREFAKNEYKSFILVDFSLVTKKVKDIFYTSIVHSYFYVTQWLMHIYSFRKFIHIFT